MESAGILARDTGLDDFRLVTYEDSDIYVIDHTTGETKAVIDEFYSLRWTERFNVAGDFELSGPEEPEPGRRAAWVDNIVEGDYIQFTQSSVGHGGRYTMIVESFYTEWDAEKGYTVYANGRSIECLLERRINLGWAEQPTGCSGYDEYKWYAMPYGTHPTEGNTHPDWPHQIHPTANLDEDWNDILDRSIVMPYAVERIDTTTSAQGCDIYKTIYDLVEYNCGDKAKKSRMFDDTENHTFNVYYPTEDENDRQGDFLLRSADLIDGRFENVYDLITKLLAYTENRLDAYGFRITGQMKQVEPGSEKTRFCMEFEVYKARDCTISNTAGNVPIIFSRDMDNAITLNYVHGMANLKNLVFFDTGLRYTPADVYELQQLLASINLEKQALQIEMNYPEPPELPKRGDYEDQYDYDEAMEQYNESMENYNKQMEELEKLKKSIEDELAKLDAELTTRDQEIAKYDALISSETDENKKKQLEDAKKKIEDRKKEDQERRDKLQTRRNQINENHEIKTPENADDATKKANERKEKERQKALKAESDALDKLQEDLTKRKEDLEKDDDNRGHEEVYYATYGREGADPRWTDPNSDYKTSWSLPEAGPIGYDRRELYFSDEALPFMNDEWQGRFEDWGIQSDGSRMVPDWNIYTMFLYKKSRNETKQADNSVEDDMEATVNYNVMYIPMKDYFVGDVVTVMGIRNNESVRKMRVDEMTYSLDASGFTVVPGFVMLPKEQ